MKAVLSERYGLENIQVKEVEKPKLEEGRVLVKVLAASLNVADYHGIHGGFTRLFTGLRRPKDPRVGRDIAGVVETVGPGITRFKPGDAVFGAATGGCAEYVSAKEGNLAPKPPNVSFEQAGAVGVGGITALQGLRDKGRIQAGQKVLVNGASGSVGTFAVQIAKAFGTEVTAVCSPRNLDQARALGADHVIDYTKEDFAKNGQRYDLIFDIVTNHSVRAYKRSLNPGGTCMTIGFGFPHLSWGKLVSHLLSDPIRNRVGDKHFHFMVAKFNERDLGTLGELLGSGKIVSAIDRRYPLSQTREAMEYLGEGHARGKIAITVGAEDASQGAAGGSA